jgi:putative ABC transport system substrate-binding protein
MRAVAGPSRRAFMALAGGALLTPLAARAQPSGRVPRIGYLAPVDRRGAFVAQEAFFDGLRELGYVQGTNIIIESRYADGQFERLPGLAAELVNLKVDAIVCVLTQASLAAKNATSTIPIVIAGVSDPVASGLVANLARPGGNVTGTSSQTSEVVGKSLEFLKEVIPAVGRVAALWNPGNAVFQAQLLKEAEAGAAALKVQLKAFGARNPGELNAAFAAIDRERVDALLVLADPFLAVQQRQIVDFASERRLPAIYGIKVFGAAGGLMTYSPNMDAQFRRAASYLDRILKGARPADLPVEQPVRFELVVNLRTAKALGITIPPGVLARADEVIE